MRTIAGASFVMVVAFWASVDAQQPGSPRPVEPVRLALEPAQPQSRLTGLTIPSWTPPAPTRFGFLTLLPPQKMGEFIRVAVPIGDLAARAAHAVSRARYRRAERKARENVQRALEDFQAQLTAR